MTRRERGQHEIGRAIGTRALLAGVVVAASATFWTGLATAAPSAAAAGTCHTTEEQPTASYDTRWKDDTGYVVRAVTLSGFPANCDGDTVVLQMWGNDEGDPTLPQSDDELLAAADSALSPCDQVPLSSPQTISSGTIELHLCRSGGPAGEVSVHDLTLLTLKVAGEQVSVGSGDDPDPSTQQVSTGAGDPSTAGIQAANALASAPSAKASAGGAKTLAFTGAELWALIACGAAAVAVGSLLWLAGWVGRRRRSEAGSS